MADFVASVALAGLAIGCWLWKGGAIARFGILSTPGILVLLIVVSPAAFAIGFAVIGWDSLPGGRLLRVNSDRIEIVHGPRLTEVYKWKESGRKFRIYDYTAVPRTGLDAVSDFRLRGDRPWSRRSDLSTEACRAIIFEAERQGVPIKNFSPNALDGLGRGTVVHEFPLGDPK